MSEIIYKYTDKQGALAILSNCSLKFTSPSEMNDPFDVYINDLYGTDLKEVYAKDCVRLFELIKTDPSSFAAICGTNEAQAKEVANLLLNFPNDKELLEELKIVSDEDSGLQKIREITEKNLEDVISYFNGFGVFCATKNPNNLLMWAHYADKHKGAVLGLKPDIEKDSF